MQGMKSFFTRKRLIPLLVVLGLALLPAALPYAGKLLLARAGARLGLELEVAAIGGNIVSGLTIGSVKGVRRGDAAQPLAAFAATDVRLDYSLPALLRGRDTFLAGLRIGAAAASLALEPAAGREQEGGVAGVALPPVLPRLDVHDLDLTVRTAAGYESSAADVALRVEQAAPAGQPVAVDIPALRLHAGGRQKLATSCRLRLLYGTERIRIEEMSVPDTLASLQGELVLDKTGQPASFAVQAEAGGGRLQGSGAFAAEQTSLHVQLDDLDIAELARLLHFEDFAVAGRLSGSLASRLLPQASGWPVIDLDLRLSDGRLFDQQTEARLQGEIRDRRLLATRLTARYGANRGELTGGGAPLTLFTGWSPARLAELEIGSFTLDLQDIPVFLAAPVPAVPGHALSVQGSMADKVLHIARADLHTAKNAATLSAARLQLDESGRASLLDAAVAGSLRFRIGDLQELAALFVLPVMAGEAQGEADISGTLRRPAGRVTLQGSKLAYAECVLGEAAVKARADSEQLHIASLVLRNGADTLEASGDYLYQSGRFAGITGRLLIEDLTRYSGVCLGAERKVSGRLLAAAAPTDSGELRAEITMQQAGLAGFPVSDLRAVLTTDWREYRITEAELKSGGAALRFAALLTPQDGIRQLRADLRQLTLARGGAEFVLAAPVPLIYSSDDRGPLLEVGEMRLADGEGEIVLRGLLAARQESDFEVRSANLTSRGWLDGWLGPGYRVSGADLLFTLQGPLAAPRAALNARLARIGCPQLAVPVAGDIAVDYAYGAGLAIRRLQFTTPRGQQVALSGALPYDPLATEPFVAAPLGLKGKVVLPDLQGARVDPALKEMVAGEFHSEFALAGTWEQPDGRLTLKGSDLFLSQFIKDAPHEPLAVEGDLRLQGDTVLLRTFSLAASSVAMTVQGKWEGLPPVGSLARRPPAELPGTVAVDGRLEMREVGWLTAYAEGLRRLAGHLQATLSMRGPAARPSFGGGVTLSGGSVRLADSTLPSLEKLELQAAFDEDLIRLQKFAGVFGGAPFGATGTLLMAGAGAPIVHCRLQGENLLLYRDESLKIRADADLVLQGPWRRLGLTGKVDIVDGRYTRNVDFLSLLRGSSRPKSDLGMMRLFSLAASPWRDMVFDVQISSAEPFPVYNNMARGAVRPNLRLTGTGEIPVLAGRIFVDPTRVTVPAGRIMIDSGVITFPENDPDRPTFDMSGQSTLAGYDISLLFQGTADEPTITLSSDPPLADDELLLLVLTGRRPLSSQDKDKEKRAMAGMNTAVYLGKGLLAKWFGGENGENEESVLERFELDFGRQLSKAGEETVEAQFRLLEGLFLPGDRLFLTSEKDVYDNFNVGVKIVFRFR
jgi:hypothetical protein